MKMGPSGHLWAIGHPGECTVDLTEVPILSAAIGGMLPRHTYLVHGDRGSGKTVLGIQVARAWLQGGRTVLYVTDERAPDLLAYADALGLSLEAGWRSGGLLLCTFTSAAARQLRNCGADALLSRIDEVGAPRTVSAVIFDPLDGFISRQAGASRQAELVRLLEGSDLRGWCSLWLARTKALRGHPAVQKALTEHCWATLALRRLTGGFWPARRPTDQDLEASFVLEIEKARQPTPGGRRVAYEVAAGVGLIPTPAHAGADSSSLHARTGRRAPRLLLASGEADLFGPLAGLLRRTMEIETVTDGVEALSRAVTWVPQVIVAETHLPRLSGFSVTRALRQGRYRMPVLLVSRANRRHSERVRAYLNGATDFAFFPFDLRDLVYRVRVASLMRLQIVQEGVEEHILEVLLKKAKSHVLDLPTFLQALSLSLNSGSRFSSPVSLVALRLCATTPESYPAGLWHDFRRLLDERVRGGDLICFPDDHEVAILLCHETRRGASAFLRRVQRMADRLKANCGAGQTGWRIESSVQTLELIDSGEHLDVMELVRGAFAEPQEFLLPDEPDAEADEGPESQSKRWGT
jgi:CheY-like chemotaxis protein